MALKLDYVVKETGRNLRRNLTLTIATVLTVAVSLALLGIALLLQQSVNNATDRWDDGVEFIIFLKPDITDAQRALIESDLQSEVSVAGGQIIFVNKEEALKEFREDFFPDNPIVNDVVTAEALPESYRVAPGDVSAQRIEEVSQRFEDDPGVLRVIRATEDIKKIESISTVVRWVVLIAGAVLLGAGLLLILNTIRMAMFARRREIEVMKLVGATNWFIRVPFMLEGTIQGLIGAGLGCGVVYGANKAFDRWLSSDNVLNFFKNFAVDSGAVWGISFWLLLIGTGVGALGSAIAANRFLDV